MNKVISVYKPLGLTPLQLIHTFRNRYPEYKQEKISYAGRLDPMAEGIMLLLTGEANKHRGQYLHLDKTYEFEVLFGASTDTYDILGLVASSRPKLKTQFDLDLKTLEVKLKDLTEGYLGIQDQPYPPYSSKTVNGKPLWQWARKAQISEITIPSRKITIYSLPLIKVYSISSKILQKIVYDRIDQVTGDFRQAETLEKWHVFFEENRNYSFPIAKLAIHCSSGTYVRLLAHELGESIGEGGLVLSLKRIQIGRYNVSKAINLGN